MYINDKRPRMRARGMAGITGSGRRGVGMGSIVGAVRQGAHDALYMYELKQRQAGSGDPTPGVISVKKGGGMGDIWDDIKEKLGITDGPVVDPNTLPTPPEDIDTGPTVQVSTIGGQVSSIPSSQAGGGFTTIGGFVSVGGVCKPTDTTSLGKFKELQRQANRCAEVISAAKIGVDGAIGPGTLGLMSSIKAKAKGYDTGSQGWGNYLANQNTSSCSAVAGGTDNLIPMLSAMADALGVSSSVASPAPAQPPQLYNPITGQLTNQGMTDDIGDAFNNLSMPMKVAALGIAGGIAFFAIKSLDKKGKRK